MPRERRARFMHSNDFARDEGAMLLRRDFARARLMAPASTHDYSFADICCFTICCPSAAMPLNALLLPHVRDAILAGGVADARTRVVSASVCRVAAQRR